MDGRVGWPRRAVQPGGLVLVWRPARSEEHTSELQSRSDLVCRLLLEKKKNALTCEALRSERHGTIHHFTGRHTPRTARRQPAGKPLRRLISGVYTSGSSLLVITPRA